MIQGQQNVPLSGRNNPDVIVGKDADDLSYARLSVGNFGLEMLRSMGWSESRGVGKTTTNALLKPVEFIPRHHRTGLGAIPKHIAQREMGIITEKEAKKKGKHGEMVAASSKDGKVRSFVSLDEKLVPLKMRQIEVNSVVVIVAGRHEGMIGRAIEVNKDRGEAEVQLTKSEENVKVPLTSLRLYEIDDDTLDETDINQGKLAAGGEKPGIATTSKAIKKEESKTRSSRSTSNDRRESKKKKIKWATPNIRVRIISDEYRNGKYYNSKVVITDILDRYSFVAITAKGELIEDLREREIETVLPKEGERVKIVAGDYAGKLGKLVKRDKSNDQVCIELEETGDFVKVEQDDCAEFVQNNM